MYIYYPLDETEEEKRNRQQLMDKDQDKATPHVLLFSFPAQGPVPPMLKLAELLSTTGFYITFVNTQNIHCRFLDASSNFDRLARLPNFRFRVIPDGLPEDHPRLFTNFLEIIDSLGSRSREQYRELLVPKEDPDGWPMVTCVVADGGVPFAFEVAEEESIPVMTLRTSSACSVLAYYSLPQLIENGEIPFQEGSGMDEPIQGIPGMERFLRRRDLPGGFLREVKCIADPKLQFLITVNNNLSRGRALTVESLDSLALSHIRSICPHTYSVGPLQLLLKNVISSKANDNHGNLSSPNSTSLWLEDRSCMFWLDRQPNKSVVYVSFGSITVISRDTFLEFWHGLINSGRRFLWVIRPDMVEGGIDVGDFDKGDQGYFVKWAPQENVLSHSAVGCFLTHSGWNSTLESIVAGVPMICWPFFVDQQINSRFVSTVWKIGLDMKDMCGRIVVEEMVRKAMEGEEAEKLRRSVNEMSQVSSRAAEKGGSSYTNFQNLVEQIQSLSLESNKRSN